MVRNRPRALTFMIRSYSSSVMFWPALEAFGAAQYYLSAQDAANTRNLFVLSDSGGDVVPLRRGPDLCVCVRAVGASSPMGRRQRIGLMRWACQL